MKVLQPPGLLAHAWASHVDMGVACWLCGARMGTLASRQRGHAGAPPKCCQLGSVWMQHPLPHHCCIWVRCRAPVPRRRPCSATSYGTRRASQCSANLEPVVPALTLRRYSDAIRCNKSPAPVQFRPPPASICHPASFRPKRPLTTAEPCTVAVRRHERSRVPPLSRLQRSDAGRARAAHGASSMTAAVQQALDALRAACAGNAQADTLLLAEQGVATALASAPRAQLAASLELVAGAMSGTPPTQFFHGSCAMAAYWYLQQHGLEDDDAALAAVVNSPLCRCGAGASSWPRGRPLVWNRSHAAAGVSRAAPPPARRGGWCAPRPAYTPCQARLFVPPPCPTDRSTLM